MIDLVKKYAMSFIGTPYKWGGDDPMGGYDCCLYGDSLVATPEGFKKIKDFKEWDSVFSVLDGKKVVSKVLALHKNGVKPTFKVSTTATNLIATNNHRFLKVFNPENIKNYGWETRKNRRLVWETVDNLSSGDIVVMPRDIKKSAIIKYSPDALKFFGAMIGDGSLTEKGFNLCFVSDRKKGLIEEFLEYAKIGLGFENNMSFNETHGMMFFSVKAKKNLIDMGFNGKSSERVLPSWVFKLTNDQLDDFLYGYLMADGSRFERKSECGYTLSSASYELLSKLHQLLISRGYKVQNLKRTIRKKEIYIKNKLVKDAKDLWTISINDNPIRKFPARGIGPNPYKDFQISDEFTFHKITKKDLFGEVATYDLTIENSHNYFANGFVVHNSGFIQEILMAFGKDPFGDQTAQGLHDYFMNNGDVLGSARTGCLVFYGASYNNIRHVAMSIDDKFIIEAAGGGSKTNSLGDAIRHNAYVRIRPLTYRKDLGAIIDPIWW